MCCFPCNDPPIALRVHNDNNCRCNCNSSCFSFFRRRSVESLTTQQVVALQALAQKNEDNTQIVLEPKRVKVKRKVRIKKTPKEGV